MNSIILHLWIVSETIRSFQEMATKLAVGTSGTCARLVSVGDVLYTVHKQLMNMKALVVTMSCVRAAYWNTRVHSRVPFNFFQNNSRHTKP